MDPRTDDDAPVMTADGHFELHDAPVDLSAYRFEEWIASGFFWALALVIFLQFFTRYALNDSASWTEEIARYLLICTVFVGAAIGVRKNNHVQVDFFYRVLPKPLMRAMSMLVDLVRIAFVGFACVSKMSFERTTMAILPWLVPLLVSLALVTCIPSISLWLPKRFS